MRETPLLRHVRLMHRGTCLSEAWNCYFPTRLPPQIQRRLSDPTLPFGRALGPTTFRRQRLTSLPFPEARAPDTLAADCVLQHQALLFPRAESEARERPFACVLERYTQATLQYFRTAFQSGADFRQSLFQAESAGGT
ncbi:hypothetical protein [Oecophyllibacter saccharovorans]|uniref:hypothetical protein n=1 Tax=Oecophyllibacter saccharovorans TaxID=2558360 RepID=UPI001170AFA8|nr:hypothetical protein [Oecophyllibacter saccharovorans]TPW36359.1 hypothetical protein E3203_00770 [Oecophyllibacter saccharovorans]